MAQRAVLHAPWRVDFIRAPRDSGCFLCEAAQLPSDDAVWKQALLLYRNACGLVVMNRYPYAGGHLLVAPLRHIAELPRLSEEESRALWELGRRCVDVLGQILHPHGFNVGMNLGRAAGAGLDSHLHLHVVPRWVGDTNFLPVLGDTRSVPIALEQLWDELRVGFRG